MSIGNRIFREFTRPPAEVVDQFQGRDTADIADSMFQSNAMRGLRQMSVKGSSVAGPAVTVSMPTGGDAFLRVAIDLTQPGDVLVISAQGDETLAMWGGQLSIALKSKDVRAVVMDSGVRDVEEIERSGLPVFARGVSTTYGPDHGFGEINVPIACGGVVVRPGDIVVADANGVVVVDPDHASEVLEGVKKIEDAHEAATETLLRGTAPGTDAAWQEVKSNGAVIH